jgi:hypothetical protein
MNAAPVIFDKDTEYCRYGVPIGKYVGEQILNTGRKMIVYRQFNNNGADWTIHPSEIKQIKPAPCVKTGGKTRRRRNRKQRKTRRH